MAMFTYGLWFFIIFIADGTDGKRSDICSGNVKCVWLNELLERKGALPRLGLVVSRSEAPHMYCYEGLDTMSVAGLEKAWSGLEMSVFNRINSSLSITVANSSQSIASQVYSKQLDNSGNGRCTVSLSPYSSVCVAVSAIDPYITSVSYAFDAKTMVLLHLPVFMTIGFTLVWFARTLSRSMAFYYGGGITVGVLASAIILLYIFSKFLPKKNIIGLGIFAGGWAVLVSVFYWFLDNVLDVAKDYWQYLTIYAVLAAVVSFAVLYRMGPITHPRTFDLIQWMIQAVGFSFIYFSTQMRELSLCLCGVILLFNLIPIRYNPVTLLFHLLFWLLYCIFYPLILCLRCFSFLNPFTWFISLPQKRFLTMDEYEELGEVETRKALSDLKDHCQNLPTRDAVHLMSRLKDTNRFTNFLNGRDHINAEERVEHDWTYQNDSSDDTDVSSEHGASEGGSPLSSHQSSSLGSSRYSQDDSPITHVPRHSPNFYRPSPSPPHSHIGSPHRHNVMSSERRRVPYSSPSKSRRLYRTTY